MSFVQSFKNFAELTRAYALGVTFASCLVVLPFAHFSENFTILNFLILVISLCCVHMGANLFDDYIDVKKQTDYGVNLKDVSFNSFIPKARLIIDGTYSFAQVKAIISILFIIPIISAFYFAFQTSYVVLLFALVGGLLTLFYPISSKYYVSELIIGLIYGPLMIMGGYYALTKSFHAGLFVLSWAIFFATLVLLHSHAIMDYEFDMKEGKKTIAILSGNKQTALRILKGMIFLSYFVIFMGILLNMLSSYTLYAFLTLPIAVKLIESMQDYINVKDVQFIPRWYYGIFENWKEIKERNIAFFMYRFYLARNFALFFAIFAAIGTVA